MVTEEQLAALVRDLRERYKPQRVILFGSYARGEAHAGSDLNLCLVVQEAGEWLERHAEFLRAEGQPFAREILEEGRVLHESRRS
jgi:predicted nucleotidyltransferase